jgi:hypothetical protein
MKLIQKQEFWDQNLLKFFKWNKKEIWDIYRKQKLICNVLNMITKKNSKFWIIHMSCFKSRDQKLRQKIFGNLTFCKRNFYYVLIMIAEKKKRNFEWYIRIDLKTETKSCTKNIWGSKLDKIIL